MPSKTVSSMREEAEAEYDSPAKLSASQQQTRETAKSAPGPSLDTTDDSLKVIETVGDIFDAPDNSVLIHACNCQGAWGTGIAEAFRKQYPEAYKIYRQHCSNGVRTGTALLIPPLERKGPKHFIGCVFTSNHYGMRKDPPARILQNTGPALQALLEQIKEAQQDQPIAEIRMCQINSGAFKVAWKDTLAIVKDLKLEEGVPNTITIFSR